MADLVISKLTLSRISSWLYPNLSVCQIHLISYALYNRKLCTLNFNKANYILTLWWWNRCVKIDINLMITLCQAQCLVLYMNFLIRILTTTPWFRYYNNSHLIQVEIGPERSNNLSVPSDEVQISTQTVWYSWATQWLIWSFKNVISLHLVLYCSWNLFAAHNSVKASSISSFFF